MPDEYTYPSGFTIKNEYNPDNGTLKKVIDKSTNTAIYEPGTYNARGQMMHFVMNNKSLYTTFGYDDYGLPTYQMTGNYYPTSTNIQYLQTNFDPSTGNLNWRKDLNRSLTELFTYDEVHKNRLATWQVKWQQLYSTTYNNANGNILTKTDFTSPGQPYSYGLNAGPHAVTGVVSPLLMPAEAQQVISYNSFKKASRIMHHSQGLELVLHYGPDEQRIKTEYKINGQTQLTRYFPGGGLEVEVNEETNEERWLHYLPGGGLYVCDKEFNKIGMYYVLTDYLGSWDKVISETGAPIEEYSFDPWGRRRNPTNWTYTGVPASFTFNRGYTGHEMLDAFVLINMNGRVYDPIIARFLSPDPFVQAPDNSQGFNRYSYCFNNPLIYTDPTGEIVWFVPVIIGAVVGAYTGASIQSGTLNPTKWDADAWKGAIVGGIIGAGVGFLGATALPSLGVNVTTASGTAAFGYGTTATSAISLTSQALISGNISIVSNYAQGRGLEGAWKAGVIGLGSGALSAGIEIGLGNDISSSVNTTTHVKLFDSDISAIAQAAGSGTYGAIDRYIRLREEGVKGWELLGYSALGFMEGAAIGALSGGVWSSNSIVQTLWSTSITSVPGLGYSILDVQSLGISHIGGLNKYLGKQTPKYPKVLTVDQIFNSIFHP
jgi:RHS repeat-associated protein